MTHMPMKTLAFIGRLARSTRPDALARAVALVGVLLLGVLSAPGAAARAQADREVVVLTERSDGALATLADAFHASTGVRVRIVEGAPTSADELVERISSGDADVIWLRDSTLAPSLARAGALAKHESAKASSVPASHRDASGAWFVLAHRTRVMALNTIEPPRIDRANNMPPETPGAMRDCWHPIFGNGVFVFENPSHGSMRMHISALYAIEGEPGVLRWATQMRRQKARIVRNGLDVPRIVATLEAKAGLSDSDIAHGAVREGKSIEIVVLRHDTYDIKSVLLEEFGPVMLPMVGARLAGGPNADGAGAFLDFALSNDAQRALTKIPGVFGADGGGGPEDPAKVSVHDINANAEKAVAIFRRVLPY